MGRDTLETKEKAITKDNENPGKAKNLTTFEFVASYIDRHVIRGLLLSESKESAEKAILEHEELHGKPGLEIHSLVDRGPAPEMNKPIREMFPDFDDEDTEKSISKEKLN